MTIDPIIFLRTVGIIISSTIGFLFLRHVFVTLGFKDTKYPIVQHAERKEPPPLSQVTFLPGSKVRNTVSDDDGSIEKLMEEGLSLTHLEEKEQTRKVHPLFGSLKDLKRAVILENLLERKWDK